MNWPLIFTAGLVDFITLYRRKYMSFVVFSALDETIISLFQKMLIQAISLKVFLILAFDVERTQPILGLSLLLKDSSSASLDFLFRAILH